MRIDDNSICVECKHFEHDCHYWEDDRCNEWCNCNDSDTINEFYFNVDKPILWCVYFSKTIIN